MKVIDLTHVVSEDISVYPGTLSPKLEKASSYEKDGFKETLLTMYSHTGTHVDAPKHIFDNGKPLDEFSADSFVGKAMIVDVQGLDANDEIGTDIINMKNFEEAEFILFYRGLDEKFGSDDFLVDYPVLSVELIELINKTKKKGIGFDVIGLDKISEENLTLHKILFQNNNIINIENLKNLGVVINEVGEGLFQFIALPFKFKNSDGAPIRAIAIIE